MTRLGWRSLRVRLPLIISAVIVLVLAAFLWTINRALVSRLVTRHGGRVWAESVLNGGATFSVSLPLEAGGTWEQA